MSKILEELEELFKSETIKPSFEIVHVILAIFIFGDNRDGIGRYRLEKELLIGSGTSKSLIKRLNKNINFISVLNDNIRKGHVLTKAGLIFMEKIKQIIPLIKEGDLSILQETIIDMENNKVCFCQVKNLGDKLTNGIEQRDAAIKIGGIGATCLLYNGKDLIFPSHLLSENEKKQVKVEDDVFDYISTHLSKKSFELNENDVIVIGIGENSEKARLAALNASLTLI